MAMHEALCVCILHLVLPKKGRRALILRADQVIPCIRSHGREDRRDRIMFSAALCPSLFRVALVYRGSRWYSAKDGQLCSLLCLHFCAEVHRAVQTL